MNAVGAVLDEAKFVNRRPTNSEIVHPAASSFRGSTSGLFASMSDWLYRIVGWKLAVLELLRLHSVVPEVLLSKNVRILGDFQAKILPGRSHSLCCL